MHTKGREILAHLNGSTLPAIEKEASGRPVFQDKHADFSISHSGNAIAVSLTQAGKTGCDIERVRERANMSDIINTCFFSQESDFIDSSPNNHERLTRFYSIWTLKECYIKFTGLSVFDIKQAPLFLPLEWKYLTDHIVAERCSINPVYHLYEIENNPSERYMLSVAFISDDVPEISWFSDTMFPPANGAQTQATVKPINTVRPKI